MAQAENLILKTPECYSPVILEASCFLVFIDETGDEWFSDPQHPVFGLGGCAMLVKEYTSKIRPMWREMKMCDFGGADVPLHASDLRSPSLNQLKSLSSFLSMDSFVRVVSVASSITAFPEGIPPFQPIALSLLKRIENAAMRFRFSSIALLVESSSRANFLTNKYLGPFDKVRVDADSETFAAPIHRCFLPKALHEPGMEIADFIMHAVGGQVRSQLRSPAAPVRKDFEAVINSVPKEAVEYISIKKVEVNPK